MEVSLKTTVTFERVRAYKTPVTLAASNLMTKLAPLLVGTTRQAVIMFGADSGGRTAKSIRQRSVSATAGFLHRQVIGDAGLRAMIGGRKAGKKMPVQQVGSGRRGGKVFEPLPEMLKWFNDHGIPKSSWFPILRSIAKDGRAPQNVPKRAVDLARTQIRAHSQTAAMHIAQGIIQKRGT